MDSVVRDAAEELDSLQPRLNVTRRGFVQTSLGAGFAAAVLPVAAQTMITTNTQDLTAGAVQIPTKDGQLPAYRAMPAGKTGLATVLVVQEALVCTSTSGMSRAGWRSRATWRSRPNCMPPGDPTKYTILALDEEVVSKVSDVQVMLTWTQQRRGQQKTAAREAGHHRILLGRAHCSYVRRAQSNLAAGVAWYGPPCARTTRGTVTVGRCWPDQGAGTRALRRCRRGIPNDTVEKFGAA